MRSFLEEGGFTAFTTNFEDLGGLRQLPGLAVQRLRAAGYGFGAEGDWRTAILVRVAKVMGHRSEERCVGKECRCCGASERDNKTIQSGSSGSGARGGEQAERGSTEAR